MNKWEEYEAKRPSEPPQDQPQPTEKDRLKNEIIGIVQEKFFGSKSAFDAWREQKGIKKALKDMDEKELSSFLDMLNSHDN